MWQGGIVTKVGSKQGSGLKISFTPQPGRLIVTAAAKKGAFTHLAVKLGADHRSVVLAFTKATPKQVTPPPAPPPVSVAGLRRRRPCRRLRRRRPCRRLRRRRPCRRPRRRRRRLVAAAAAAPPPTIG